MQPTSLLDQMNAQLAPENQATLASINNGVQQPQQAPQVGGTTGSTDISGLASPASQATQIQAPAQQNTPNWLEKLLPTAGGILGSIGGALIPGLGEIGIGEGAGGAAGSAAGQALEDVLTGNKTSGSDIGSAALEGGIGGVGGKLAGGLIGGAGKLLSGKGEKAIQGVTNATEDAAKLANAQRVRDLYSSVTPKQGNVGGAATLAGTTGADMSNPQSVVDTARNALHVVGGNRDTILGASPNIPVAGIVDANGQKVSPGIQDIIKSSFDNTNPTTGESIGLPHTSILGDMTPIAQGKKLVMPSNDSTKLLTQIHGLLSPISSGNEMSPTDLLGVQQNVGTLAAKLRAAATADPTNLAAGSKADVISNLNSNLKNMMYNRPSVDSAVSALPGNIQAADVGGNQQLADVLNQHLGGAQTGQDLNNSLSSFINMRNVGNAGLEKDLNPASVASLNAVKQSVKPGATVDEAGNPIVSAMTASKNPHVSLIGHVANALGGKGGAQSQNAIGLGNLLQKISPVLGMATGQTIANSPNTQGAAGANTAVGEGGIVQPAQSSQGGIAGIMNDKSSYAAPLQNELFNSLLYHTPISAGAYDINNKLQGASSAQSELANLTNLLNQAGGAQGTIGGFLSKLGAGFTGGPAATYDTQAAQLTDQINKLLGTNVQAPNMMQDQTAANDTLRQLQQALLQAGANGGQSSL